MKMKKIEALTFLKFWKSTTAKVAAGVESSPESCFPTEYSFYEDDSFFELELTFPHYDLKSPTPTKLITQSDSKSKPNSKSKPHSTFRNAKKPKRNDETRFLTVKFGLEDGSIVPRFDRSDETSKRFSIDIVHKYLNRMKPRSEKIGDSPARSSSATRKEREEKHGSIFIAKCKQLRKSKSASEVIGASSPVNFPSRSSSDHCCHDLESAILHCKRSLYSS